ncbi:MAG: hypothetical protein M3162_07865 [Thermoproteota archaeon]|nr:hypothetical protein [Thermoproteota archaeon]
MQRYNNQLFSSNTDPLYLIKKLNIPDYKPDPKVLILTKKNDLEVDLLGIKLLKNDIEYVKVTEEDIPESLRIEFNLAKHEYNSSITVGKQRVALPRIKLILLRYFDPRYLAHRSGVRQIFYLQQWYQSFLTLRNSFNGVWINDPVKTYEAENRILQLRTAKEIGFNVPKTLITNDPLAIKKFCDKNRGKKAVIKVLHHHRIDIGSKSFNFFTKDIDDTVLEKQENIVVSPVIVQTKIERQSEIRVTIIGNKIFAFELTPEYKEYSDIHTIGEKKFSIKEVKLERKISSLCTTLAKKLGLIMSSIDLILSKNNKVFFLEINPIGDWHWIEKRTNTPITEAVCQLIKRQVNKI